MSQNIKIYEDKNMMGDLFSSYFNKFKKSGSRRKVHATYPFLKTIEKILIYI